MVTARPINQPRPFADQLVDCQRRLLRVFKRMGFDPARRQDLAHDVLLVAWKKRAEFSGDNVWPWLSKIAFYVGRSARRKQGRLVFDDGAWLEAMAVDPTQDAAFEFSRAQQCLDKLTRRSREIFVGRAVEGRSASELADVFSVQPKTVYGIYYDARERLRLCLSAGVRTIGGGRDGV